MRGMWKYQEYIYIKDSLQTLVLIWFITLKNVLSYCSTLSPQIEWMKKCVCFSGKWYQMLVSFHNYGFNDLPLPKLDLFWELISGAGIITAWVFNTAAWSNFIVSCILEEAQRKFYLLISLRLASLTLHLILRSQPGPAAWGCLQHAYSSGSFIYIDKWLMPQKLEKTEHQYY